MAIDYVFSVAPESEWSKIYDTVNREKTKLFTVLTGYLDETTIAKIEALNNSFSSRSIDIGYRSGVAGFWLGRLGLLKQQIATQVQRKSALMNLSTDISTHSKDTFLGDEWYRFLLQCKYTLGLKAGPVFWIKMARLGRKWIVTYYNILRLTLMKLKPLVLLDLMVCYIWLSYLPDIWRLALLKLARY